MNGARQRMNEARSRIKKYHVDPIVEFVRAAEELVKAAEERATKAEVLLEAKRPLWAQGHTSDSVAAQAHGVALEQLWTLLGVDNQTSAITRLNDLLASQTN